MAKKPYVDPTFLRVPTLCAPNNGYDENGLWNGMTPEEVHEACRKAVEEGERMLASYHYPGVGLPIN